MAQDFGDDIGEMLIRGIRSVASRAAYQYLYHHGDELYERMANWFRQRLVSQGAPSEVAKAESEAFASRKQVLTSFGNKSDASYFAQVCRENGIYAAALTDKDGNGYIQFAKDDLSKVESCIPRFTEVMTALKSREIAEQLENGAPVSFEALKSLTFVDDLPDLPTKAASAPTRDVTLIPVAIRFNDEPDNIEMRLFAEQDTEGLDIDDDVFFSGYSHDKLESMVGKDTGEDFTVMSVGQPYHVQARELAREAPGKEATEHGAHVHDDRANDAYSHTKGIADKVKAAREQCRDYEDFKGILAKEGVGVTTAKDGELMYYEARPDGKGGILPFGKDENGLKDWSARGDTLKRNWGVDATRDWFAANTPKEPSLPPKDLQLICNAVRADLEQQGIPTRDRPDGKMGFLVHRDHEQAVIEAVENRYPGHVPEDLGIKFIDDPHHDLANVRIPTEPQVADTLNSDLASKSSDYDAYLRTYCRDLRANLERQGIETFDTPDGDYGFAIGSENYPYLPKDLPSGVKIMVMQREYVPVTLSHNDPQVADGSKDMDGRTPDIDQGIESHDGRDTMTATARMEYEQTASGDVAPSDVREQADARSHDDGRLRLKDVAKECRAASQQLEKESGITEHDIDISDKFNQIR